MSRTNRRLDAELRERHPEPLEKDTAMLIELQPGHCIDPQAIRRVMSVPNGVDVWTVTGEHIRIKCKDGERLAGEIAAKINAAAASAKQSSFIYAEKPECR